MERMKMSLGSGASKALTLKEVLEIFHYTERAKDAMLEVDPYLERSMTVCQGIEKMFALCHKLCGKRKASTLQRTLRTFFFFLKLRF